MAHAYCTAWLASQPAPAAAAAAPAFKLSASPAMDAGKFQQLWGSLTAQDTVAMASASVRAQVPELANVLRARGIMTMASGGQEPVYKFYNYAQQEGTGSVFLVELIANTTAGTFSCTCKSDGADSLKAFCDLLSAALQQQ
ncbi:MAG: hypothetical protein GY824_23575 [Delftia sp.]|nr:hypothetical protein [Delftia sp.]